MGIRICALGVPQFRHGGLVVTERWGEVSPGDPGWDSFVTFTGRFIQIHPEDKKRLGDFGLTMVDGRLVKAAVAPTAPTAAPPADVEEGLRPFEFGGAGAAPATGRRPRR